MNITLPRTEATLPRSGFVHVSDCFLPESMGSTAAFCVLPVRSRLPAPPNLLVKSQVEDICQKLPVAYHGIGFTLTNNG